MTKNVKMKYLYILIFLGVISSCGEVQSDDSTKEVSCCTDPSCDK